ncbi:MAG: DUF1189 family protein [Gammaproteobacteria bacterium]|nr:DUF1189 family protein [Gammaproteobacteria bacterium]
MKKTNLLLAIPYALYSKRFYQEVAKTWIGRSFVYLLILLALCWIPTSLVKIHSIWRFVAFAAADFSQQLPVIHIKDGVASTEAKTPVFIQWTKNQKLAKQMPLNLFAVIDTEDQFKDFQKSSAVLLIRSKTLYIKQKNGKKTMEYQFPKNLNATFGPKEAIKMMAGAKKYIYMLGGGLIYFFGLALSYVRYLLLGLIYGLIGWVLNANLKRKLDYGHLLGIALVTFTPTILLKTLLFAFNISFPFASFIFYLIPVIYLYFAIKSAE